METNLFWFTNESEKFGKIIKPLQLVKLYNITKCLGKCEHCKTAKLMALSGNIEKIYLYEIDYLTLHLKHKKEEQNCIKINRRREINGVRVKNQ